MKKRIFAASMASVMALSSVSVVAFADETVKADAKESVTKAELKEYVASFDAFLEDDIFEYGTIQSEQFQHAIDYATNVAASSKATDVEVNAAYQMVKSVRASLQPYTAAQLQELINDNKDIMDSNNIMNEKLGDRIYTTESYEKFEGAYNDATSYVGSDDGRLITDMYIGLKEAIDGLVKNPAITKAKYRAILKDYEAIKLSEKDYEPWRRGTVSVNPVTGTNFTAANPAEYELTKAAYVTYGDLLDIVTGASTTKIVSGTNDDKTKWEVFNNSGTATWIDNGGKTDVDTYIHEIYDDFDKIATSNKTTDEAIVAGYNAAEEAVKVFASWKADATDRSVQSDIDKTINKYRAKLVKSYKATWISTTAATFAGGTADPNIIKDALDKDGKWLVKADVLEVNIDKKTGLMLVDNKAYIGEDKSDDETVLVRKFYKGADLVPYIPVFSGDIKDDTNAVTSDDGTNLEDEAKKAFEIVEDYKGAVAAGGKPDNFKAAYNNNGDTTDTTACLKDIDVNNVVSKATGSRTEYTLINRYLTYALSDLYPEAEADKKYTRADVKALIEATYVLCEQTGDSETFNVVHMDAVKARQEALDWLAAANAKKDYKDYEPVDGANTDSTTVYNKLYTAYDALKVKFDLYPKSYGEIEEKISEVSVALDAGSYNDAETIKTCLEAVAKNLAVLDAKDDTNKAFTFDREFIAYNRLYIGEDATNTEKALSESLALLDEAIKADKKPDVVKGDLDSDGVVSANDALLALKAASEAITLTDAQKAAADLDDDGYVTAFDALAILKAASQG